MSVDLEGDGDLAASLSGIGNMLANLEGSGDLEATIAAFGNMYIDITVTGTGLSLANVGQAVWETLITQYSANPDSAAAKLLAAGSAGDPWSTALPASYTGTQAGAILDRIQTLIDELHKIQGLDASSPMSVTPSQRTAGTIDLAITGDCSLPENTCELTLSLKLNFSLSTSFKVLETITKYLLSSNLPLFDSKIDS